MNQELEQNSVQTQDSKDNECHKRIVISAKVCSFEGEEEEK